MKVLLQKKKNRTSQEEAVWGQGSWVLWGLSHFKCFEFASGTKREPSQGSEQGTDKIWFVLGSFWLLDWE